MATNKTYAAMNFFLRGGAWLVHNNGFPNTASLMRNTVDPQGDRISKNPQPGDGTVTFKTAYDGIVAREELIRTNWFDPANSSVEMEAYVYASEVQRQAERAALYDRFPGWVDPLTGEEVPYGTPGAVQEAPYRLRSVWRDLDPEQGVLAWTFYTTVAKVARYAIASNSLGISE